MTYICTLWASLINHCTSIWRIMKYHKYHWVTKTQCVPGGKSFFFFCRLGTRSREHPHCLAAAARFRHWLRCECSGSVCWRRGLFCVWQWKNTWVWLQDASIQRSFVCVRGAFSLILCNEMSAFIFIWYLIILDVKVSAEISGNLIFQLNPKNKHCNSL